MKSILKRVVCGSTVIGILYFSLFDTTPRGTECERLTSPNGLYVAERCVLRWVPRGDSKYVGRLFDAKSGRKLAQHTFSTPVPQIAWFDYTDVYVSFSIGDDGDDSPYISLPPSKWDRILAARPHL